jgi:hypothetical protein
MADFDLQDISTGVLLSLFHSEAALRTVFVLVVVIHDFLDEIPHNRIDFKSDTNPLSINIGHNSLNHPEVFFQPILSLIMSPGTKNWLSFIPAPITLRS